MKQKTTITIVFVGLASLALGWFIGFSLGFAQGKITNINTYEECVAAGYPVQESYPQRCAVPSGNTYTNPKTLPLVETTGQVVCLQHKDPSQPHTLECTAGLQAENGETYTLKEGDAELTALAGSNQRVRVQGKLDDKDSDTYQSTGELTVDSYTILE